MENKHVGYIVIGFSLLLLFVIFSFNRALTDMVSDSCGHGSSCPMWGTIRFQTNVSLALTFFVVALGVYLIFFAKEKKITMEAETAVGQVQSNKVTKENYQKIMDDLGDDEKVVFEKVIESKGTIFQSELVERTSFSKVKVTRLLDKLEGKGLLERRRRGMSNVVILKYQT